MMRAYASRVTAPRSKKQEEPQHTQPTVDFTNHVPNTSLHLLYQFSHLSDQMVQRMKRELSNLDVFMRHANADFFGTAEKNKVLNRPGKRLLVTKQNDRKLTEQEIFALMDKVNGIVEHLGDTNNIFCFGAIHDGMFYPIVGRDRVLKPAYSAKDNMVSGLHKVLLLSLMSKLVRHHELKVVTMSSLLTNNIPNTYDTL
jgi:hypothetical protein